MAWIKLHQSIWEHRKTIMLASQLGIHDVTAAGHMARLWCWALDNAPSGSLEGMPNIVIAKGAGWQGDAELFVTSCMAVGFIDQEHGVLFLHDWEDYAGKLIERRVANTERMRGERAQSVQRTTCAQDEHMQRTCAPRVEKSREEINTTAYTSEFEEFWKVYPNKKGKQAAFKCWEKRLKECSHTELMTAAQGYAKECVKENRESRFIMHAQTFLGPQRRYEDYLNTQKVVETPPPVVNHHTEDEEALDKAYDAIFGNKRIH